MAQLTGHRIAERSSCTARMFYPEEALKIGLIDEVVAEQSLVMDSAQKELEIWCNISGLDLRIKPLIQLH